MFSCHHGNLRVWSQCNRRPTLDCNALGTRRIFRRRGSKIGSKNQALSADGKLGLPELPQLDDEGAFTAAHKIGRLCNWLIPGRVLVGRYPYMEPSRCFDRQTGEQQLQALLKLGVNTFVCLQAEIPPQEKLPPRGVHGFMPYKPVATMMYSSLGSPPSVEITGSIRNSHLDKFLPPRRQEKTTSSLQQVPELQFLHSPIPDLGLPGKQQVTGLLEDLSRCLEIGGVIYLHCWGGRGRAGTIGACLLAKAYGIDADEALARVQKAFDTRGDNKSRSPETAEQREFVKIFVSELK